MAIDLRKLRYLVETARYESVTRAAAALRITQSALTRSIAEVEAELQLQLFIRLPRGVRVTDAGADFIDRARRLVGDFDELLTGTGEYRSLTTGRLRLGVAPAGYHRFINRPVSRLAADHPGLTIDIVTGSVTHLAPRLALGELDAMLAPVAMLAKWPDLAVDTLADFNVTAFVRPGHPLARMETVTERDVLGFPIVMPATVEALDTDIAGLYQRNGLPPLNGRYNCDDFDLTCDLVENTDAFALVISLSPGFGQLANRFHLLQGVVGMPQQQLGFAHSPARALTPAAARLREILQELVGERGG